MPLRTIKKDAPDAPTLEWVLQVKNRKLNLGKKRCVGCEIRSLACPKEVGKHRNNSKQPVKNYENHGRHRPKKRNFCDLCDKLCPYGASNVTIDGKHICSVLEKERFPQLIRDIQVNESKTPLYNEKAEDTCPLKPIKILFATPPVEPDESLKIKANISIEEDRYPCYGGCEVKLLEAAIHIHKLVSGKIVNRDEKCLDDCRDLIDQARKSVKRRVALRGGQIA